jgi:hypothetical protein
VVVVVAVVATKIIPEATVVVVVALRMELWQLMVTRLLL